MRTPPSPKSLRGRLSRQGPFLIIFGFAVALLYRLTLKGEALYWGDIFLYFQPLESHVQGALRQGQVPLWNPYVLCGQPLVGNPQSWVIYPSTFLVPLMPVWAYFTLDYVLHIAFAGVGIYLYARRLCGDRMCGVLAAMTYMGSGFLMSRLQFPTMVQAAAYLPWLLLLTDRLAERPGVGYATLLAIATALEILAGHPQLAYMSMGATFVYLLSRLYLIRKHHMRVRAALGWAALAVMVGLAATSAQVLPMLQLFGLSTREKLTWAQANRFVLHPQELVNFVAPYFQGNPAAGDFWGEGNLWESCVYVGVIPLLLAAYGIVRRIHRRAVVFFTLLGGLSLWLALGKFGGLFWLAFYVIPGLASFHDPARFTFLTTFALAALAAYGLRALRDHGWTDRQRAMLVAAAALNIWAFSAHINPTIAPAAFRYRPRFMASAPEVGEARVFSAQRDRVWQRFLNYSDYGPDSARYAHELTDTVSPNIGMRFGVEEASGYEPVPVRAVTEVDALVRTAMERKSPGLTGLLGLFNTGAVLLPESTRYTHPGLQDIPARGTTVLAVRNPFPRAWLVRRTMRVDGYRRGLATLSRPEFDPHVEAVVSDVDGLGGGSISPAPAAPVIDERSSDGRSSYVADAGSASAYLVVSATWYPGWRATVDGRPASIGRTNCAFRGVYVPPGPHRIVFRYEPAAFQVGLFLTLASLWLIVAGLISGAFLRRGKQPAYV